ncbi:unnamed protein product [Penicillium manginii]
MRFVPILVASLASISLAAPAPAKRQEASSDPLSLGPTVEDITNKVTGLVGSILKRQEASSDPLSLGPTIEDVTNQVTGLVGSILKRQEASSDPLSLGPTVEDVTNQRL